MSDTHAGGDVDTHSRHGWLFHALDVLSRCQGQDALLDAIATELCNAGPFDRAVVSRIDGSTWLPTALCVSADAEDETDRALRNLIGQRIALTSPMLETELVRKRATGLVEQAQTDPRTLRRLVEASAATTYIAAPVVTNDSVVALIHVDNHRSGRALTMTHRDLLSTFAEGVGLIYERALMLDRLAKQRECFGSALSAARAVIERSPVPPAAPLRAQSRPADHGLAHPPAHAFEDLRSNFGFTEREHDVLRLLARGATNTRVAYELSISESTVKSHVKHIFRKLGTTTRAEAIARYLRCQDGGVRRAS
jgi:DNA-binding CsgD family transcriptional regulator